MFSLSHINDHVTHLFLTFYLIILIIILLINLSPYNYKITIPTFPLLLPRVVNVQPNLQT